MHKPKKLSLICLSACAVSLTLLGGCATRTPLDVGAVVVAPQARLPDPPVIVQQTSPKPVGYFQQSLVDYFSSSPGRPTPSTQLMPVAGQTPTQ